MKKKLLQIVKAVALGILALLLLVLTVFELLPNAQTALTAKDTITVSPSVINSAETSYQLLVSGTLFNDSDETFTVDALTVKVSDGTDELDIYIPLSLTLVPRAEYDLAYSTESPIPYSHVKSVTVSIAGSELPVSNESGSTLSTVSLLLIALTLVAGYFCYRSILVCYYAYKEKSYRKN